MVKLSLSAVISHAPDRCLLTKRELVSAVHIKATGNITVSAGSINDLSSDTYLVLPVDALSTQYYAASYLWHGFHTNHTQGPTFIGLVGVEDFTVVKIYMTQPVYQASPMIIELFQYTTFLVPSFTIIILILGHKASLKKSKYKKK